MQGTLEQSSLTNVLQGFRTGRQTGILHLSFDGANRRVYFKEGEIVFASSDVDTERLGEILVRIGKLKRDELDLACKVRDSSSLRLGKTIVEMGYLREDEMDLLVKRQVEAILGSLLPAQPGSYRAEFGVMRLDADLMRKDISTENLLLEAVRGISDSSVIRESIGDLTRSLRFTKDPMWIGANLKLTPEEGFVLSRVDGESSSEEIAQLSPMGEDHTLRCIGALVVAGVLEVERTSVPVSRVPLTTPDADFTSEPAQSEPTPPVPAPPTPPPTPSPKAVKFHDEMLAKHETAHEVTYYELLDIEPNATPDEIKAGYFRLAKRLHPDHRSGLKVEDPDGVFDDLYLAVKAAYEVLSSAPERRRYDFSLESQRPVEPPKPKPSGSRAPEGMAPPRAQEPVKRPARTFDAKQMARLHFSNGQRFYTETRFHEAIDQLQEAVRLDPRTEYRRVLAHALSKNPKWIRRAEEQFLKVLEVDHFDIETMLALGEIYEAGGMEMRARKMYEEALGMDPGNERALAKLGGEARATAMEKLKGILHRSKGH